MNEGFITVHEKKRGEAQLKSELNSGVANTKMHAFGHALVQTDARIWGGIGTEKCTPCFTNKIADTVRFDSHSLQIIQCCT